MGEALFDLEQVLRSKQGLTSQEVNILLSCKSNAVKDFTLGVGGGAIVTWLATRRLSNLLRINIAGGAGAFLGFWRFGRSLDSCTDHILSLDGSRMQKELAQLMLDKYQNDARIMQRFSKHFYLEEVYDDSISDRPNFRWRTRNTFQENASLSERTQDDRSYGEKTKLENTDVQKTNLDQKPTYVATAVETMENPFDCIFGDPSSAEEIDRSDTQHVSPKRHSRSHKRSHRRHRMRQQEASVA